MEEVRGDNHTSITQFLLLGFGSNPQLHIFLFLLFLLIYMLTMTGNILIIVLVVADPHLHTPMYFFLGNLSSLETCYTSTVLPRMLASLVTGDRAISVSGCITQFYFFASLAGTECCLVAAMSYDRYLAICKPLLYAMLMNGRVCLLLATGSWLGGLLGSTIIISLMSQLTFCGHNEIDHFFCDFAPVIQLSCSDTRLVILVGFITSFFSALSPFLLTLVSYICIIDAILRIPSGRGRQKAFATCSSHLIVVTIFYGTILIVYLLPKTSMLRYFNKAFSIFYTILTPLINPLIYSLRNREVKEGLRKVVSKFRILGIQTTRLI